ncbi:hypothetical protein TKK_0008259 [Trichogramma kaykai]
MPPRLQPGTIYPAPPPMPAMLPCGPPQVPYTPLLYWTYSSPPVSPTNYYNPAANVHGIATIPQQATIIASPECLQLAEPRVEALIPRPDMDKRIHQIHQPPCSQYVDLFII